MLFVVRLQKDDKFRVRDRAEDVPSASLRRLLLASDMGVEMAN